MDVLEDYYTLFGLKVSPEVDLQRLETQYKVLQKAVHPDQFSRDSEQQKRLAVQYCAYINQAYEVLKSPVARCQYLLVLAGHSIEVERTTLLDESFLLEQMELREQVEKLKTQKGQNAEELKSLIEMVRSKQLSYFELFKKIWNAREEAGDFFLKEVVQVLQKMQFMNKVLMEIEGIGNV